MSNTPSAKPIIAPPPTADSIMVVAAHPDDMESWCAGTLALACDAGAQVRLLLVTSGDKGSSDPGATPAEIAQQREAEAREAGRRIGLSDVAFLRFLDGEVENTREFRQELVAWIRYWRPDTLFTFDPEHPYPPYTSHRDHRIVGRATIDSVHPLARDPLCFPEQIARGLQPHKVRELWLFASTAPTHWVDIRKTLEQKIAARLEHTSQTLDPEALRDGWRKRAAEIGQPADLAAAEAFAVVSLV